MSEIGATQAARPAIEHIVRLRLVHETSVTLERVPEALGSPRADWLGEPVADTAPGPDIGPGQRGFLCDLELHAGGDGPALFRKAALVTFGEPRRGDSGWIVPMEWRATSLTPLFPVFVGRLRLQQDRIELDGRYAPPGGTLGYLLDAALLGVAARQTGRWFLRRLAAALR